MGLGSAGSRHYVAVIGGHDETVDVDTPLAGREVAEHVVEGPVLEHQYNDVVDLAPGLTWRPAPLVGRVGADHPARGGAFIYL